MKGRKPKPTALKLLDGDFNKDPQLRNHNEPEPEVGVVTCPAWITGDARTEWKRVSGELMSMGVATLVDRAALEQYTTAYASWRDSLRVVAKEGRFIATESGPKRHPACGAAQAYADLCHKLLIQFGMTPSSRTRLHIKKETDSDAVEKRFFG